MPRSGEEASTVFKEQQQRDKGLSSVQKGGGRREGQPSEKPQEEFGFYSVKRAEK